MECPKCGSMVLNNPSYQPRGGLDPAQREYICSSKTCNSRYYKVLNLKLEEDDQAELL